MPGSSCSPLRKQNNTTEKRPVRYVFRMKFKNSICHENTSGKSSVLVHGGKCCVCHCRNGCGIVLRVPDPRWGVPVLTENNPVCVWRCKNVGFVRVSGEGPWNPKSILSVRTRAFATVHLVKTQRKQFLLERDLFAFGLQHKATDKTPSSSSALLKYTT